MYGLTYSLYDPQGMPYIRINLLCKHCVVNLVQYALDGWACTLQWHRLFLSIKPSHSHQLLFLKVLRSKLNTQWHTLETNV